MKKTFMLLLALSGAAMADGELYWTLDFGTSAHATNGYKVTAEQGHTYSPTVNLGMGYTLTDDAVTTVKSSTIQIDGATGVKLADEFSCVVQLALPDVTNAANYNTDWPIIFSFGEDNKWCVKADIYAAQTGDPVKIDKDGYTLSNEDWKKVGAKAGVHTLIFTMSGASGQDGTLHMYWDGVLAEQVTVASSNRHSNTAIDDLSLGGRLDGGYQMAGTFHSVQMYGGVLSAGQIATLSVVPEPTTATLSLLALAGLAARRRRK